MTIVTTTIAITTITVAITTTTTITIAITRVGMWADTGESTVGCDLCGMHRRIAPTTGRPQ